MRRVVTYYAFDGKSFDTEYECREYEKNKKDLQKSIEQLTLLKISVVGVIALTAYFMTLAMVFVSLQQKCLASGKFKNFPFSSFFQLLLPCCAVVLNLIGCGRMARLSKMSRHYS